MLIFLCFYRYYWLSILPKSQDYVTQCFSNIFLITTFPRHRFTIPGSTTFSTNYYFPSVLCFTVWSFLIQSLQHFQKHDHINHSANSEPVGETLLRFSSLLVCQSLLCKSCLFNLCSLHNTSFHKLINLSRMFNILTACELLS